MALWREFIAFTRRGNVVDMAVGIIIGAAFLKIITSVVSDIIMPFVGLLVGNVDVKDLKLVIGSHAKTGEPIAVNYGALLSAIMDFLIVALIVFLFVKVLNRLKNPEVNAAVSKECPECLSVVPLRAKRCSHCTSTLLK
jgi:large conductance mechanosensitive channel